VTSDSDPLPVPSATPQATPKSSAVPKTGRWTSAPAESAPAQSSDDSSDKKSTPVAANDNQPKESGDSKNSNDSKDSQDSKDSKNTKDSNKSDDTKQSGDPKDTKDPKDNSADFEGPGVLKPTIYYFVTFNEDESKCDRNTMMHAAGGRDLLMVCEKTAKECGQQGSCAIIQNGVTRSFNVLGAKDGQDRFFEINQNSCRFGYGVNDSCLDPFYTLAADLSIYKSGDVIFVPAVVGMQLPDGSKHSGYFVIRDRGRGVDGVGRFDFFSGTVAWMDRKNPFTKMGLGDTKTNIPYYKVTGKTARQVLRHRAFPRLPSY
jgi:hypothetical protein